MLAAPGKWRQVSGILSYWGYCMPWRHQLVITTSQPALSSLLAGAAAVPHPPLCVPVSHHDHVAWLCRRQLLTLRQTT